MPKILLVEDDKILSAFVKQFLTARKFTVDTVFDGEDAINWLTHQQYDAIIMDWHLGTKNGPDICKEYRASGGCAPILMLTQRGKVADKVHGLEAGADDYLPKPFDGEELFARLKSLLRRPAAIRSAEIVIGKLAINLDTRTVKVADKAIETSAKEFSILELLASNQGHLFSGDAILNKVWASEADSSVWAVRTHIARLRSKINDVDPDTASMLKTVYGQGYKIEA